MATWGSHFRIAENLLQKFQNLDRKYFLIGSIGPDCCIPNEDWSTFTPSKEISHFFYKGNENFLSSESKYFLITDIKFYSEYLKNFHESKDGSRFSFLFGYFIHLLTDNLWNYYIMKPLKEKYLSKLQENPNFIWKVKTDWYDLDKIYLMENKNAIFWTDFLDADYKKSFLDFLPKEGIKLQMKYIKNFYQITDQDYSRILKKKYLYLNKKEMDLFVLNSTKLILKVLFQIKNEKVNSKGIISFLDNFIEWK